MSRKVIERLSQLQDCIDAVDMRVKHYEECITWSDAPRSFIEANRFYCKEIMRYRNWLANEFQKNVKKL